MIRKLRIEGWRAFDRLTLALHAGVTFVVAENGIGKTSLIQAAGWGLYGSLSVCDSDAREELNSERAIADRIGRIQFVVWGARDVLTPTATNVERYRFVGLTPTVTAGWGHSRDGRDSRAFVAVVPDFIEL